MRERNMQKQQSEQAKKSYEVSMLQSIKDKEEAEQRKQDEAKNKIMQQKVMRDMQLQDAKKKKQNDF